MEKSGIKDYSVKCDINSEAFENIILEHPFYDINVPLIRADHVTDENGTGAVHIAPGHGTDDYLAGLKNNLEVFNPVDDYGKFIDGLKKANIEINRKILSEIAFHEPAAFKSIVEKAKANLAN